MYWYWWAWFVFVVLLIFVPLGYGWGYRGWGPPYPRYYYRRRAGRAAAPITSDAYPDDPSRRRVMVEDRLDSPLTGPWGVFADLLWLAALGAAVWAVVAFSY